MLKDNRAHRRRPFKFLISELKAEQHRRGRYGTVYECLELSPGGMKIGSFQKPNLEDNPPPDQFDLVISNPFSDTCERVKVKTIHKSKDVMGVEFINPPKDFLRWLTIMSPI